MEVHLKVGQIWQEVDPRLERYIRISGISCGVALIETVEQLVDGVTWRHKPKTKRNGEAALTRFTGKRGGYKLYQDVARGGHGG